MTLREIKISGGNGESLSVVVTVQKIWLQDYLLRNLQKVENCWEFLNIWLLVLEVTQMFQYLEF